MTEQERQEAVDKIKKHLKEKKDFKEKLEKLKKMTNSMGVSGKHLTEIQREYDIASKLYIRRCFLLAENKTPCSHDIWIYSGSYALAHGTINPIFNINGENSDCFTFNKYICLDCLKYVNVSAWQEFEKTHFVLRNPNGTLINFEKYQDIYFELLQNYSLDEARKIFVQKMNNGEITNIQKETIFTNSNQDVDLFLSRYHESRELTKEELIDMIALMETAIEFGFDDELILGNGKSSALNAIFKLDNGLWITWETDEKRGFSKPMAFNDSKSASLNAILNIARKHDLKTALSYFNTLSNQGIDFARLNDFAKNNFYSFAPVKTINQ